MEKCLLTGNPLAAYPTYDAPYNTGVFGRVDLPLALRQSVQRRLTAVHHERSMENIQHKSA